MTLNNQTPSSLIYQSSEASRQLPHRWLLRPLRLREPHNSAFSYRLCRKVPAISKKRNPPGTHTYRVTNELSNKVPKFPTFRIQYSNYYFSFCPLYGGGTSEWSSKRSRKTGTWELGRISPVATNTKASRKRNSSGTAGTLRHKPNITGSFCGSRDSVGWQPLLESIMAYNIRLLVDFQIPVHFLIIPSVGRIFKVSPK